MDEMLPPSDEGTQDIMETGDITLPEEPIDETPEVSEEEIEEPKEEKESSSEKKDEEKNPKAEDDEEELDLSDLLDQLSDNEDSLKKSDDAISNIESTGEASKADISVLKEENSRMAESLKRMEDLLRKVSSEKSDLVYKNAELEAFGGESSNPQILILSRNLEKANSGDDRSKSKVISTLKDMLENLTGEDYESKKTEKKVDLLSAAESYNSGANPNIKSKSEDEDNTLVM